jgi:hypothetical protein
VRNLYIKPDHPVFDLVPPALGQYIQHRYEQLGSPVVNRQSAWDIYLELLHVLQRDDLEELPAQMLLVDDSDEDEEILPLLEDYDDLPFCEENDGFYYMGGVGGGLGLGKTQMCRQSEIAEQLTCDRYFPPSRIG